MRKTKQYEIDAEVIAYNPAEIKLRTYDIREWSPDHDKTGKGVTLSKDEFTKLKVIISEI